MRSLSLKWRIGILTTSLLVVVIALLSTVAYLELKKSLLRTLDNTLNSDVDAIVALVESEDSLAEARKEINAFLNPKNTSDQTMYRIWFEGQNDYIAASSSLERWPSRLFAEIPPVASVGQYETLNAQADGIHYRLIWAKLPYPRQFAPTDSAVNVVIAIHSSHIIGEMKEFLEVLLVLGTGVIVGSFILTSWILRWGLKPVANLTGQMDDVSGRDMEHLERTIPESPSELRPFVTAWDSMLERLALAMQQQRRFTADASHQLRTPLTIAKSTLQTSRSRRRSPEVYVSAIDETLEDLGRLEHLIEQLLALARLDDISAQPDWQKLDLRALTLDVCQEYATLAEAEDIALRSNVPAVQVEGNDEQLRMLLSNLVDNAIRYGPSGGEVFVSVGCSNGFVNISVHDQGGTIPTDECQHIFERFYRIRKAVRDGSTGSGLGLAIAQEIAHRHKGSIRVTSDLESGTEFVVTLPRL
ncbi:MAG: sensor histidine kinase N-terminal domain-containing protein [Phycisphaerales bacterium]|nr:MAG: sensor histidine kinase N-terminal domain-containing protein [Phycisphaerales bacterium]